MTMAKPCDCITCLHSLQHELFRRYIGVYDRIVEIPGTDLVLVSVPWAYGEKEVWKRADLAVYLRDLSESNPSPLGRGPLKTTEGLQRALVTMR